MSCVTIPNCQNAWGVLGTTGSSNVQCSIRMCAPGESHQPRQLQPTGSSLSVATGGLSHLHACKPYPPSGMRLYLLPCFGIAKACQGNLNPYLKLS